MKILKAPDEEMAFSNKDLKRLYIPLLLEQTFAVAIGMIDSVMVSGGGEAALSGVALVNMINIVVINLMSALSTGGAVVTAQYLGARRPDKACLTAWQLMMVSSFVSIVFTTTILTFRCGVLTLVFGKINDDVMQNALTYFTITAISFPFLAIYNSCAALFRSMGNSKISMQASLLMNILHLILNAVFIYALKMSVAGAAYSTLICRMFAAVLLVIRLSNRNNEIFLDFEHFPRICFPEIKRILRIGIPSGLENSMFQLGRVLVLSIITLFGTAQIAANAAANTISTLHTLPAQAVSLAMVTVVGQCMGAGKYEQAEYYVKKLMILAHVTIACVTIIIVPLLPFILSMFNLSDTGNTIAMQILILFSAAGAFFWPPSFSLPNALRAASDVKYTMIVSIFSMITFRILFSYIIAVHFNMGALGVWIAMVIDWVFRALFFITRFIRGKWKTKRLIDVDVSMKVASKGA